MVKVTHVL